MDGPGHAGVLGQGLGQLEGVVFVTEFGTVENKSLLESALIQVARIFGNSM